MAKNQNINQTDRQQIINPGDFYHQLLSGRYHAFSSIQQKQIDQAAKAQGWGTGYLEMLGVLKEVLHFIHENALFYPVKDLASWMESVRQIQINANQEIAAAAAVTSGEANTELDLILDNLDIFDAATLEEVKASLVLSDTELNTNTHNLPESLLETLRTLKKETDLNSARRALRAALLELKNQPQLFKQLTSMYKQVDAEQQNSPSLG